MADDTGVATHLEASLQHDIDLIRAQVRMMADLCERAIGEALAALVGGHRQPAYLVILRDQQIDEAEQQLDRLCLEFLVRHQPAAGHLRFGYAALKISSELERIGDHAEAIARRLLKFEADRPAISYAPFQTMANASIAMMRDAVRAFDQKDGELARNTMLAEETIDRMRVDLDTSLASLEKDRTLTLESFAILSAISRRIERMSDEVRDMCAETIYMCTGDFVKHRAPEVFRVLFVDRHNHCRSQMAEAIATNMSLPHMLFTSAGLDPQSIDPRLPAFLAEKGLDVSHHRPKSIEHVPNLSHYHVVIAFDQSVYYSLRFHRTLIVCIDWSVADPSTVEGTPAEVHAAYEHTFTFIRDHLKELVEAIARQG